MSAHLNAKIRAANRVFKRCNELHTVLAEFFRSYVGKVITKNDGSLLAKVAEKMPKFGGADDIRIIRTRSNYMLGWDVDDSEQVVGDCGCLYFRTSFNVGIFGDAHNGESNVLKELVGPPKFRDDWTAEEITAARDEAKRLQRLADEAKSKYNHFGEYDR